MSEYAHPEVLVSTTWVADHLQQTDRVRIVESDEDVLLYDTGHIPNAVKIDWHIDLQDPVRRDYVAAERFRELCESQGISDDTTVVFYGDKNNWWACYAFWTFKLFGHADCRVMNGGRQRWIDEGRDLTRERSAFARGSYRAPADNTAAIRAFRDDVLKHLDRGGPMIDVRSPGEYSGELLHMADYPQEGSLRGGHIPGAVNVPWARAIGEDGRFKSVEELRELYREVIDSDDETLVYCRIGERSSHTWFVLKYLLGFDRCRNYDGSWTEWGNLVGVPIKQGSEP
ncbi:MAG: sulfurtransferase [Armatimonadetes bacterium]|nr:sulfurtransferase [Armatimonadota bacterium]